MNLNITLNITLDVDVWAEIDRDDDGCGSPSSTGNSMTGARGRPFVSDVWVDMTDAELLAAVRKQINRADLVELAQEAFEDSREGQQPEIDSAE